MSGGHSPHLAFLLLLEPLLQYCLGQSSCGTATRCVSGESPDNIQHRRGCGASGPLPQSEEAPARPDTHGIHRHRRHLEYDAARALSASGKDKRVWLVASVVIGRQREPIGPRNCNAKAGLGMSSRSPSKAVKSSNIFTTNIIIKCNVWFNNKSRYCIMANRYNNDTKTASYGAIHNIISTNLEHSLWYGYTFQNKSTKSTSYLWSLITILRCQACEYMYEKT